MKRLALIGAAVAACAITACTPEEVQLFRAWYADDPQAAQEFADGYVAAQQAAQSQAAESPTSDGVWDQLADCEAGGNWAIDTGNGYSGGLQFLHSTWRAYGGEEFAPRASQATKAQQIVVAERIVDDVGWRAWPTCARRLGLL